VVSSRQHTRRAAVVTAIGGVLLLAAVTAQAGWLYVLAAGVLGLVTSSTLVPHRLRACEVERAVPARAAVGEPVSVRLSVRNRGRKPTHPMVIEDAFGALERARLACDALDPAEEAGARVSLVARRRGAFGAGRVTISCGWPFGLIRSRRSFEVPSRITIAPRYVELPEWPFLEPRSAAPGGHASGDRAGDGVDMAGLREHRPGDPLRAIHWRSSARRDHLVVREFEEAPREGLALVLSGRDHGSGPDSSFEVLVSAAASIGLHAHERGHPVDFLTPGSDGGVEELRDAGRPDLLDRLAVVEPHDASVTGLLAPMLGRASRAGVVVVLVPTSGRAGESLGDAVASIRAAGGRPVVVLALADTWDDQRRATLPRSAGRVIPGADGALVVSRGDDLRTCLDR